MDDDIQRARESLEEKLKQQDERADAWDPQPGETLVGRVVDFIPDMQTSDGVMPLAKIKDVERGKTWAVWLNRKVLMDQWSRENISDGDAVAIVYQGTRESQSSGREYHDYIVTGDPEAHPDPKDDGQPDEDPPDIPKNFGAHRVDPGKEGQPPEEPEGNIPF